MPNLKDPKRIVIAALVAIVIGAISFALWSDDYMTRKSLVSTTPKKENPITRVDTAEIQSSTIDAPRLVNVDKLLSDLSKNEKDSKSNLEEPSIPDVPTENLGQDERPSRQENTLSEKSKVEPGLEFDGAAEISDSSKSTVKTTPTDGNNEQKRSKASDGDFEENAGNPIIPPATLSSDVELEFNKPLLNELSATSPPGDANPENSTAEENAAAFPSSTSPTTTSSPSSLAKVAPQIGGSDQSTYRLAEEPRVGDVFEPYQPQMDRRAVAVPANTFDFDPGPCYENSFDPEAEMRVYEGKHLNAVQRPLVELGQPWYQLGQLPPTSTILGAHNPVVPQFVVFGDSRVAAAANNNVGDSSTLLALQTNLFFDLKLTGTERFNMFVSPSTRGTNSTRYLFDDNDFQSEFNFNVINGFFEGDLGSIWGGLANQTMPFDLPFAVGIMPLLFQNGVWMEDNILGLAATIPARNSPALNISNMDITFFAGYDNINSPAFGNDANAARVYGFASFLDVLNGYLEIDYAFLDDRNDFVDRSYHNVGIGYSRRFGRFLSHSSRVIVNAGQDSSFANNTADGVLLLSENSLITSSPSTIVPYLNLFAGFDRPQSVARAAAAGGVLRNTGVLFESDNLRGYPTLDSSAQNTFGGALGVNMLPANFGQQLILETAMLGVMKDAANRQAIGPQYGLGARYQLPINHTILIRADAMIGFLEDSQQISGLRLELRKKF